MPGRPADRSPALSVLALVAAVTGLPFVGSCGSTPGIPSPAPTPVTARAFVYLLEWDASTPDGQDLATYQVLPDTGDLVPIAIQPVSHYVGLGVDPEGQFLFATGGPEGDPGGPHPYWLRSNAIDSSGELRQAGEVRDPAFSGGVTVAGERLFVKGSVWTGESHGWGPEWVICDVGEGGSLTRRFEWAPTWPEYPGGWLLSHAGGQTVHVVQDDPDSGDPHTRRGITTWSFDPMPKRLGSVELLRLVPTPVESATLVDDFILLVDRGGQVRSVRLAAGGGSASLAGELATGCRVADSPSWLRPVLAVKGRRVAIGGTDALCLVELGPSGELIGRGKLAAEQPTQLAFHPSGDFLYSAEKPGLKAYAVAADGTLIVFQGATVVPTGPVTAMAVASGP